MRIDVFLDVSCPWCYIAKRRIEEALRRIAPLTVEVVRHPYQIDGEQPQRPMPMLRWLAGKYGPERAARMDTAVTAYAARMGLVLRNRAGLAANTLAAHRLLWLAGREYGEVAQRTLEELLFAAYFTDAADVSHAGVLTDRATRAGLAPGRVTRFLATGEGTEDVRALVRRSRAAVAKVPTVVVGDSVLVEEYDTERIAAVVRAFAEKETVA
ncbi:polyketide synthase [Virgisporangium aliadipatigenens]|uniref:Polyketide synthase n=1 Tax=Virgisporangium aliadipatigenens TaxID=741659 RepID=A0A8J4DUH5_9ACTN|nr:DsbA family oxidoreductase [Virgisporangium aliadipatigenens]GIJ50366.1 polyketide synthase [Virgisporangium aliadipatigenens]